MMMFSIFLFFIFMKLSLNKGTSFLLNPMSRKKKTCQLTVIFAFRKRCLLVFCYICINKPIDDTTMTIKHLLLCGLLLTPIMGCAQQPDAKPRIESKIQFIK